MHNQDSSIQQFQAFVELKDFRPKTKSEYVRCVVRLAGHYSANPAELCEEQVRAYFIYLRRDRGFGPSGMTTAKASLRSFFNDHLRKNWTVFSDLLIRKPKTQPLVLSRAEVARVINAVNESRFRVCLKLIYHCGLRVGEAVHLRVQDIKGKDLRIHIKDGKGGKDRFVPIARTMLEELRQWWKVHRHPEFLFPGPGAGWRPGVHPLEPALSAATGPMAIAALQEVFRIARATSGINPEAVIHTLRHSYATHLMEEGISLRLISQFLGHESLETTVIYTHLTATSEAQVRQVLEKLDSHLRRWPSK